MLRRKPRTTSARGGGQDGKGLRRRAGVREEVADVARWDRGLRDGADDVADIGRRKGGGAADERVVGVAREEIQIVGSQKEPFRMKRKQN